MSVLLYGNWRSLATYRVRIALKLKKIAFQETMIDLPSGEHFSEAFNVINPQHAVPAVNHNGALITQSSAILEYLEEAFVETPLLPRDAVGRAKVRALAQVSIADTHPLTVLRVRKYLATELSLDDTAQTKWARHWLDLSSAALEAHLTAKGSATGLFAHGDTPTLADVALASHMFGVRFFGANAALAPKLCEITERCFALPAFSEADPTKQPGAPGVA
jgi:maleylacetoacetate isomerase